MGDLSSIVVAVVTTIGTILVAAIAAGRIGRGRGSSPQAQVARWRDQADLEKARAEVNGEERDREHELRVAAESKLAATQHDLDDCVRQRDGAYSDLRAIERRRPRPRGTPPA